MIQRIQSLYLLMAAGCMALMHLWPFAFGENQGSPVVLGLYRLLAMECPGCRPALTPYVSGAAIALLLISIFMYRRRSRQVQFIFLAMLFILIVAALLTVYYLRVQSNLGHNLKPGVLAAMPLPAMLLSWLAVRAIRKDEALVQAADRLR